MPSFLLILPAHGLCVISLPHNLPPATGSWTFQLTLPSPSLEAQDLIGLTQKFTGSLSQVRTIPEWPPAHLSSGFTCRTRQARGPYWARRATVSRCTRRTLLSRLTLEGTEKRTMSAHAKHPCAEPHHPLQGLGPVKGHF
jgi:hypothetical protein